MTDKMKNILKIVVFGAGVLVLLLVFSLMMRPQKWFDNKLVQNRDSRYIQISEQKEDTIDVFNIGDSLSLAVFSPMELWRQQGHLSTAVLQACALQPLMRQSSCEDTA